MSTNVATLPTGKSGFSLAPQSLDEAMRFADTMAKSSIVPKDYQGNPGNILVAVQWGAEIGLQPLQAMQNIAVVNGRPSIWGDAMIALVKGAGLLASIEEDIDDKQSTCTVQRRGEAPVSRTFTMEDAKRAGLAGKQGPWTQYPKRMLQMRARSWALRDVFPDVLKGVYIAEEARDMPAEKDITPESETVEPPKSRAEKARAALEDRRKKAVNVPPVSGPDVAEVMAAISAADGMEALQVAADLAGKLTDEAEKKEARQKYADKMHALKTTQETPSDQDDDFLRGLEAGQA
jgi:RecT family